MKIIYKQKNCSNSQKLQWKVAEERERICHEWADDRKFWKEEHVLQCHLLDAHHLLGFMCTFTVKPAEPYGY